MNHTHPTRTVFAALPTDTLPDGYRRLDGGERVFAALPTDTLPDGYRRLDGGERVFATLPTDTLPDLHALDPAGRATTRTQAP